MQENANMEEIKKKVLEQKQAEQKEMQMELQLAELVKNILTPEARTRLNNIKLVNRELYLKTVQTLIYLIKTGQMQGKLGEAELKNLLKKMQEKKEIKITRK